MALISIVCVILSIVAYCCKTSPAFTIPALQIANGAFFNSTLNTSALSQFKSSTTSAATAHSFIVSPFDPPIVFVQPAFIYIEFICNIWFLIEFLIRLTVTDNLMRFLRSPLNLIEFTAVISFYTEVFVAVSSKSPPPVIAKCALELLSIVRVMRLFKLTRYISGLKILILTFKASAKELSLLVFFLMVFIVLFAALVFYAERFSPSATSDFTSIPIGLWWAIVTMTTVGYGDMTPKSYAGKALCFFHVGCYVDGKSISWNSRGAKLSKLAINRKYKKEHGINTRI